MAWWFPSRNTHLCALTHAGMITLVCQLVGSKLHLFMESLPNCPVTCFHHLSCPYSNIIPQILTAHPMIYPFCLQTNELILRHKHSPLVLPAASTRQHLLMLWVSVSGRPLLLALPWPPLSLFRIPVPWLEFPPSSLNTVPLLLHLLVHLLEGWVQIMLFFCFSTFLE